MEKRREGLIGEAIRSAKQVRKLTLSYVKDLKPEQLAWCPAPDANPILWLLWHVGEIEESVLWTVEGKKPSFRFGRSALQARDGRGPLPAPEEIMRYLEDVRAHFLDWLQALPDADLEKLFGEGVWQGKGQGLISLPPRHETYHCGQIAYIRRLMGAPVPDRNEPNPYR